MSNLVRNNKLKRAAFYASVGDSVVLYDIDDKGEFVFKARATRIETHDWMQGRLTGNPDIDPPPPTVDEMLESIAAKLQDDVKNIMEACATSEAWLRDMYQRSKEKGPSVSPPWR